MLHFLQSFILYSFCAISMLIGIFEIIYIHVLESINHKLSQDFVNFCLNHALHGSITVTIQCYLQWLNLQGFNTSF